MENKEKIELYLYTIKKDNIFSEFWLKVNKPEVKYATDLNKEEYENYILYKEKFHQKFQIKETEDLVQFLETKDIYLEENILKITFKYKSINDLKIRIYYFNYKIINRNIETIRYKK